VNPRVDLGAILARIASAVSAHRVRADEQVRASRNGIEAAALRDYAGTLTKIADELEKALV
jgi:hypothetical protein